jgi:outer membrane protein OmpA-like peptidoglycan-associated protein
MKILVTGFVVFVIWSFISTWLYVDMILPAMHEKIIVTAIPEIKTSAADSLAQFYASMPKVLMIHFEFDKIKFIADPQTDIRISDFKSWLDKHPSSVLAVVGFTDLVGTAEYNKTLGLKRAKVIQNMLENKGIPAVRIMSDSKGKEQPVADYLTAEGRAMNRRVEISIKK